MRVARHGRVVRWRRRRRMRPRSPQRRCSPLRSMPPRQPAKRFAPSSRSAPWISPGRTTTRRTRADLAANAILHEALGAALPGLPTISEETYARGALPAPARFWLIDPLDGTREFLDGNGEYTVNVALIEAGAPVLGVVPRRARRHLRGAAGRRRDANRHARNADDRGRPAARRARRRREPLASRCRARDVSRGAAAASHATAGQLPQTVPRRGRQRALYPRLGPTSWWDTAAAQTVVEEAGGAP